MLGGRGARAVCRPMCQQPSERRCVRVLPSGKLPGRTLDPRCRHLPSPAASMTRMPPSTPCPASCRPPRSWVPVSARRPCGAAAAARLLDAPAGCLLAGGGGGFAAPALLGRRPATPAGRVTPPAAGCPPQTWSARSWATAASSSRMPRSCTRWWACAPSSARWGDAAEGGWRGAGRHIVGSWVSG